MQDVQNAQETSVQLPSESEIQQTIGLAGKRTGAAAWIKWTILALVAGAAIAGAVVGIRQLRKPVAMTVRTERALRANVDVVVTATGTLSARKTVTVGTEVSGRVQAVHVTYNDAVTVGQVLIEIDPQQLSASVRRERANVAVARASVRQAETTLEEARKTAERVDSLRAQDFASEQEQITARANFDRAEAALATARAQAEVTQAALSSAETQLAKTIIHSPIDGIVLDRTVEPGQTVNGSFQTPTLLTLAEDLTRMELDVDVDEADVGSVRAGQTATFTVAAFPGRTFPSVVREVRNAPTTVNNVVTYKAVLDCENAERLLRPGMTATVTVLADRRANVLTVPNSALRFVPPATPGENTNRRLGQGRHVWIRDGAGTKPLSLQTGASDGQVTEVLGGEVREGMELVVEMQAPARGGPFGGGR